MKYTVLAAITLLFASACSTTGSAGHETGGMAKEKPAEMPMGDKGMTTEKKAEDPAAKPADKM